MEFRLSGNILRQASVDENALGICVEEFIDQRRDLCAMLTLARMSDQIGLSQVAVKMYAKALRKADSVEKLGEKVRNQAAHLNRQIIWGGSWGL